MFRVLNDRVKVFGNMTSCFFCVVVIINIVVIVLVLIFVIIKPAALGPCVVL